MVVRGAVTDVLGAQALPEPGPNMVPHTSIGYGIADGDSGTITSTLQTVRIAPVEVPITALHLVAVQQHRAQGRFTWDHLAELPLAG
jgi:hypothetical protein